MEQIPRADCQALCALASPFVEAALPAPRNMIGELSVSHVEAGADWQIYEIICPINFARTWEPFGEEKPEPFCAYEIGELVEALSYFCSDRGWRDNPSAEPAFDYAGNRYLIGDGDDSQAVQFRDNAFRIWLRTWGAE